MASRFMTQEAQERMNVLVEVSGFSNTKDLAQACGISERSLQYYIRHPELLRGVGVEKVAKLALACNLSFHGFLSLLGVELPGQEILFPEQQSACRE